MASAKDLKKKIRSISNTKKITRTMEMVAGAKSKRAQSRVNANTPYSEKLAGLLENLSAAGSADHYLLRDEDDVSRAALLVVTANRGFCGGYNTNVITMAERWMDSQREAGRDVDLSVIGSKGIKRFRFHRIKAWAEYAEIDDRPTFKDADEIARGLMERFRAREIGRAWVISTRYYSVGTQKPTLTPLLPLTGSGMILRAGAERPERARELPAPAPDFLFEPGPEAILSALLPFSVANLVYRLLIEAVASEQIARRVAMKLATDNAEEVIRSYTRMYNRQRQAGITQQIAEIVGGAEALQ